AGFGRARRARGRRRRLLRTASTSMNARAVVAHPAALFRHSPRDAALVAIVMAHALVLAIAIAKSGESALATAASAIFTGSALWLNDGFHAEHPLRPSAHWTTLPSLRGLAVAAPGHRASALPPVVRFLESLHGGARLLGWLERLPLMSPFVRRVVVEAHVRAF